MFPAKGAGRKTKVRDFIVYNAEGSSNSYSKAMKSQDVDLYEVVISKEDIL